MISVLAEIMIIVGVGTVGECFRNVLDGFILGYLGLFLVREGVGSRLKRNLKIVSRKKPLCLCLVYKLVNHIAKLYQFYLSFILC